MLATLAVRDIVLIDQLDIDFSSGMTVLTGETGAGKSILLDSLSLALGGRGDGGLVREGAKQGQVVAIFDLPPSHPAFSFLLENDIEANDELILRRVQSADGRTRAFVNDQPISARLLRALGVMLVEIHGQHDERALVDPVLHRQLLDAFGGHAGLLSRVSSSHTRWRKAGRELSALQKTITEARQEADYLKASVEELALLGPQSGEEQMLAGKRQTMMQSERIADDLHDALETISGNGSPIPTLSSLLRNLTRKADNAPGLLDATIESLDQALNALEEGQQALEVAVQKTDFNPGDLEETEERLFAIRGAARKFQVTADNLPELAIGMQDELDKLDSGEERLKELETEVLQSRKILDQNCHQLSDARSHAKKELVNAVMDELPALKLEHAKFIVQHEVEADKPGAAGYDNIEFWVQTNPGTRPGPMMKVASGGELSRFLLALKVSLADKGSAPTLVFDEIDTGVGGAVAEAIGARLQRLSNSVQVLSVTHAPQVAALAGSHMKIAKLPDAKNSRLVTDVVPLTGDVRLEEVARMLAGAQITDEARAAASQLMSGKKQ